MIDAHQHFWQLGENDCAWPTAAEAAIHRDFLPADWEGTALPCGVTGSVLVQSQESVRDTAWLLDLAGQHDSILGVVGWADLARADFPQSAWLKGLRPMVQDKPADWLDDPALAPGLREMAQRGLVFDALVRPRHLPSLKRLAERHADLWFVIDHMAKPEIAAGGDMSHWRTAMDELAALPNVACKLSGLLNEVGEMPYDWAIEWVAGRFAPDRLIWGSDWPVVNLVSDYARWLDISKAAIPVEMHAAVFEANARRIYRL